MYTVELRRETYGASLDSHVNWITIPGAVAAVSSVYTRLNIAADGVRKCTTQEGGELMRRIFKRGSLIRASLCEICAGICVVVCRCVRKNTRVEMNRGERLGRRV